jgi:[ribosomal protein S18]-alanine N-acetyltransferase
MGMIIRDATAADIPTMQSLELASEAAAHWPLAAYEEIFRSQARARLATVLEEEGQVLGFMIVSCSRWDWEIEEIVIANPVRRRGLGSLLLGDLLTRARKAQLERIHLEVRKSNEPARNFYMKLGFQETGSRTGYYSGPAEDALLYQLDVGHFDPASANILTAGKIEGLKPL